MPSFFPHKNILFMNRYIHQLCDDYIKKCEKNPLYDIFRQPVRFDNVEDDRRYRSIVKHPMDLSTLKKHLEDKDHFKDLDEWAREFRLIFDNAMQFHPEDTLFHCVAKFLRQKFDRYYSRLKHLAPQSYVQQVTKLYANYIEILTHPPPNSTIKVDVPFVENIQQGFDEASLIILKKKLQKISRPERFEELQKIIQSVTIEGQDPVIDVGSLPKETIKNLWEYVRKYESKK